MSIQIVKSHPIKSTYKLRRGHWTRETTYVSENAKMFYCRTPHCTSIFTRFGKTSEESTKHFAEIIITWNTGIILLLSSEETLMHLFISFVLRNAEIHQVMKEHSVMTNSH